MLKSNALEGKVCLITGGGTGLGKAMAIELLKCGATVAICGRRQNVLDDTCEELSQYGRIGGWSCDVREYEQVDAFYHKAMEAFGRPNQLINNAAGNFVAPTEHLSPGAFDAVIDIVLKGTKNMTLAFGKQSLKNNIESSILNVVTTYSWTGSAFVVPSAMAKAGVLAMTRSLAVEWGGRGIRVNAVAPGLFPTKGAMDRLFPESVRGKFDLTRKVPVKRVGKPEELGQLVTYLLSDYASFINGEVVTIDGGEWLKGAGQFNMLDMISEEEWLQLLQAHKK